MSPALRDSRGPPIVASGGPPNRPIGGCATSHRPETLGRTDSHGAGGRFQARPFRTDTGALNSIEEVLQCESRDMSRLAPRDARAHRLIVGRLTADHARSHLVVDAFQLAIARRQPEAGLLNHSYQDSPLVSLSGQTAGMAGIARWDPRGNIAHCPSRPRRPGCARDDGPGATGIDGSTHAVSQLTRASPRQDLRQTVTALNAVTRTRATDSCVAQAGPTTTGNKEESMDTGTRTQTRRRTAWGIAMAIAAAAILALAPTASAGTWDLVSCRQPTGLPAPTEGWSDRPLGTPAISDEAVNTCSQPGGALVAVSGGHTQPASSGYQWRFAVPAGSSIAGGQLQLALTAPHGIAAILTSETNYDTPNQVNVCGLSETCGISGSSATIAIGHPGSTGLYANAICFPFGEGCGEISGVNAKVAIYSAQILLESNVSPSGTGFSGGLLSRWAAGVQDLQFYASVPSGPGIWRVAAAVDGQLVYDQTPDTNGGKCQSIGTAVGGVSEFLYEQPCKQAVAVSIPVNTNEFETGAHQLTVSVADAAGNTSTVFDRTIETFNAASQTPWKVSLKVSPHTTRVHRMIKFVGHVLTVPTPATGKLIYLQARAVTFTRGSRANHWHSIEHPAEWLTFKQLRAKSNGEFHATYRFRLGGRHFYQFRAVAPKEGGFNAATGRSAIVSVLET